MKDKLDEIMEWKRQEILTRLRPVKEDELSAFLRHRHSGMSFQQALRRPTGMAVVSEVKRKSPSAGPIAEVDAAERAREYYNAGTDAISVLTDERYFGGSIRDLWDVYDLIGRRADAPPLLRKDFFVHPIQVLEAAEAGARAILIIVRVLSDDEIRVLFQAAETAGMDALFEVHTEQELERALTHRPRIVGVNNRDLQRFETRLEISEDLLPLIPEEVVSVSESGIWSVEDAERVYSAGADAVLVGESLMRMEDEERESFVRALHEF